VLGVTLSEFFRGAARQRAEEVLAERLRSCSIALMMSTAGPFLPSESLLRLPHLLRDASSRERFIERLC
jgi:hypothetical protein